MSEFNWILVVQYEKKPAAPVSPCPHRPTPTPVQCHLPHTVQQHTPQYVSHAMENVTVNFTK